MGHHAETICHHSLSVLYSPRSHVDHDCYLQSGNEIRRKRSNGLVCPVCCLCIPTSVIMSKSHSDHRCVGKWVARTKRMLRSKSAIAVSDPPSQTLKKPLELYA